MANLTLPTVQVVEPTDLVLLKWFLYGSAGLGKSTFMSQAVDGKRKPLFLSTDSGLRFIKCYKKSITSWRGFDNLVDEIIKTKPKIYSMIVIDTVDILFKYCQREACLKLNITHPGDLEWGKGYSIIRDKFETTIAKLISWCEENKVGFGVISHSKDIEIRGRTVKTSKLVPTLSSQAYGVLAPLMDLIGYVGFSPEKADRLPNGEMGRLVIFEPSEELEAKDRTGRMPAQCKLDYEAVREAYEGTGESEEEAVEEEVIEE